MRKKRTGSSRLDHVSDGEPLDGLILGSASRAVGAADGLDVAAALLVATAVEGRLLASSLDRLELGRASGMEISYLFFLFLGMLTVSLVFC